jgi:protein phosphatase
VIHIPPPFAFAVSALTDVGCVRTTNEDHVRVGRSPDATMLAERGVLLLVADGMGGHLAGEVASQLAADTVHHIYFATPGPPGDALVRAFHAANRVVHCLAEEQPRFTGMGTTGTALVLCGGLAFSANVGDSRIYLVRDGAIRQMTSDDSPVGVLVRQGLISAADARHHADKHVIHRAIGAAPAVTVSTWDEPLALRGGDRFLLCSDGLHDVVDEEEILIAVRANTPDVACEQLVALARKRGGYDNITVAAAHVIAGGVRG